VKNNSKFTIKTINLHKKRIFLASFLIFLSTFCVFMLYMSYFVTPLIISTSESKIKTLANRSMNIAVTTAMAQDITYEDLIDITKDSEGNISSIHANSITINSLAKLITRVTQENLMMLTEEPVQIPLGAFTGITAFSGLGPKLNFDIHPYGDISCKFSSDFVSAGINQTHHKIYMNIDTKVNVILPFKNIQVQATSAVLVCESVIIGKIPSTYLRSDSLDEMMNLIPVD